MKLLVWSLWVGLIVVAFGMGDADSSEPRKRKKKEKAASTRTAEKSPKLAPPVPRVRDGETEARLIEVYRLIGQARGREALAKAEGLVRDHPNFQLAQLAYGDLLAAQSPARAHIGGCTRHHGPWPERPVLAELREESQVRMRALRERPPAGFIPSQFLSLSSSTKHAIAVDASRSQALSLFENTADWPAPGRQTTTSRSASSALKRPSRATRRPPWAFTLSPAIWTRIRSRTFYGSGALPINYPNAYDIRAGQDRQWHLAARDTPQPVFTRTQGHRRMRRAGQSGSGTPAQHGRGAHHARGDCAVAAMGGTP
jgi:hypothetical protein